MCHDAIRHSISIDLGGERHTSQRAREDKITLTRHASSRQQLVPHLGGERAGGAARRKREPRGQRAGRVVRARDHGVGGGRVRAKAERAVRIEDLPRQTPAHRYFYNHAG